VAIVVLLLGLSAGVLDQTAASTQPAAAAVAQPPSNPPPRNCDGATEIRGVTQNGTDTAILTAQVGLGPLTAEWCNEPKDEVRRTDGWRATNDSGDTEVFIIYLLDNGDRVRFTARERTDGTADGACSVELARPPRQDEVCQVVIDPVKPPLHRVWAYVRFILLPAGQ
jgi:hypothetical protein